MRKIQSRKIGPKKSIKKNGYKIEQITHKEVGPCTCFTDFLKKQKLDTLVLLADPGSIPSLIGKYKKWKFELGFCVRDSNWREFSEQLKSIVMRRALSTASRYDIGNKITITSDEAPKYTINVENKSGKKV